LVWRGERWTVEGLIEGGWGGMVGEVEVGSIVVLALY